MSTQRYTTPGYVSSDPMNHYQHICDSCKIVKSKRKPVPNIASASFPNGQPQPYDPHNHITHYLNVCFDSPDALRCHLVPNDELNNGNQN